MRVLHQRCASTSCLSTLPGDVDAVGGQETSSHRLEALAFAHDLLALPGEGPVALLVLAGHTHDTEGLAVAPGEAVEPLAMSEGVEAVVLHSLAALVPVQGLDDLVGHAHRGELAIEVVAEGPAS